MTRFTVLLGHISGIALRLHASAVITVAVLTAFLALSLLPATAPDAGPGWHWGAGAIVSVAFFVSLLPHELAHARAARRYGVTTLRVTLWLLGGAAEVDTEPPRPRAEAMIALAGPALSTLLGTVCWATALAAAAVLPPIPSVILLWLGTANLAVAVLNLLPGVPFDGGRLVHALLWARTGDRDRADRIASRCGQVVGAVLLGCGAAIVIVLGQFVGIWLALLGWFAGNAATAERAHAAARAAVGDLTVRAIMADTSTVAPGWWTVETLLRHSTPRSTVELPVVAFDGSPVGLVRPHDLARLPQHARRRTRVADVCRRPPAVRVVAADVPVRSVLSRRRSVLAPGTFLVAQGPALVGVLTARDLRRAADPARAHPARAPNRTGAPP